MDQHLSQLAISEKQVSKSDNPLSAFLRRYAILAEEKKIHLLFSLGYCLMQIHNGKFEQLLPSEISLLIIFFPNAASDRSLSDEEKQAHVRSLANFYCNFLTNGRTTEYSETLTIKDLVSSSPYEALDIIEKLANGRMTASEVTHHPFHWTDEQKVLFISRTYDFIKTHNPVEFSMDDWLSVIPLEGWVERLSLTEEEVRKLYKKSGINVGRKRIVNLAQNSRKPTSNKKEFFELLRFFRNRYVHMHEDAFDVRACFGNNATQYLKFFSSRFPKLLMHVYTNLKHYMLYEKHLNYEKFPSAEELVSKLELPTEKAILITRTNIVYYPNKRLQPGANVFKAVKGGVIEQKIVVKFITNFVKENIREIQLLEDAGHSKYVVKYIESDYCEYNHEDAIYIAMEKCEKKTLSDRIGEGDLSFKIRKQYVRRVAKGLQHLKNKDIMHRDLKPSNILFRDGSPVIADFGLSKKLSVGQSTIPLSRPNVGTDGWRAPETSDVGCRTSFETDIFAAGLVFHFVLTDGAHPYGDKENQGLWQARILLDKDESICNLQALNETPDGAIAFDLIQLMLRRERKERPSIEAVLKHPFFLNAEEKLEFLSKASAAIKEGGIPLDLDSFDGEKYGEEVKDETKNWNAPTQEDGATYGANSLAEDEKRGGKLLLTKEEMATIEENFKQKGESVKVNEDVMIGLTLSPKRKQLYDGSVAKLLCFIRNRHTHRKEDEEKKIFSMTREQFLKFFSDRFPHLLIYVYYRFKHYYFPKEGSNNDLPDDMEKYFAI